MLGGPADGFIYVMNPDGSSLTRLTGEGSYVDLAWSPDGERIAFAESGEFRPHDIYVMKADGTNVTRLTDGFLDYGPSWSPDGSKIAFSRSPQSGTSTGADIYVMDSDGTDLIRLTNDPAPELGPSWSPDGGHIAVERDGEIYVMASDGSHPTKLTDGPNDRRPAWSPDGNQILFLRGQTDVVVIGADGSDERKLSGCSGSCDILGATWSPDGRKIAFDKTLYTQGADSSIYVMNADGTGLAKVKTGTYWAFEPSWQSASVEAPPTDTAPTVANGEIWYFSGGPAGGYVYSIQPDGSDERQVFRDTYASEGPLNPEALGDAYDWSSDGARVAFMHYADVELGVGSHWDIFLMNPDGTGIVRLTREGGVASDPSWSPDGTRIAYAATQEEGHHIAGCWGAVGALCPSDIYVINADGTGRTRLTDDPAKDSQPDWSPDGSMIVFTSTRGDPDGIDPDLYVMNADGTGVSRLPTSLVWAFRPHWSPDGDSIAFVGFDGNGIFVYVMDADGSGVTRLTDVAQTGDVQDVVWSPDGTEIAFTANQAGSSDLFVMNRDGTGLIQIATGRAYGLVWRPIPG
jgi:TolB protein